MEAGQTPREKLEAHLLCYIDIPYFRNNPAYIELWRSYYNEVQDPQILLLMYYKQISTYFHWIYLELARHFVKIGKVEIAHFALTEAIRNGVYDKTRLEEALSKLPPFRSVYNRNDMACILNQSNIYALGKVWNKTEDKYFYELLLDPGCISFEIMAIQRHLHENMPSGGLNISRNAQFGLTDSWVSNLEHIISKTTHKCAHSIKEENNLNEDIERIDDREHAKDIIISSSLASNGKFDHKFNQQVPGVTLYDSLESTKNTLIINGEIIETPVINSSYIISETLVMPSVDPVFGNNLDISIVEPDSNIESLLLKNIKLITVAGEQNNEILIEDGVHIIQEKGKDYFITLKISKDANITQTISGGQFLLKHASVRNIHSLNLVYNNIECVLIQEVPYLFLECDKLADLPFVLSCCNELSAMYYLDQILCLINRFKEKSLAICDLNFIVNSNFKIMLFEYKFEPITAESSVNMEKQLVHLFSEFIENKPWSLENISECVRSAISTREFKREVLSHKTAILNKL